MKKTIYFHIGISKTGTSSLQNFCYENRDILEENGFLYPIIESDKINNGNSIFFAARDACNGIYVKKFIKKNRQEFQQKVSAVWYKMKKIIDESKAQKILISSESFGAYPFVLWEFLDHKEYDIKLVVYMRNSLDHLVSYYKQHIKSGRHHLYSRNLIEFIANFNRDYFYEIIEDYTNYLGKENIIVRPYEKQQLKNGNTVDDFFDIIGFKIPDSISNFSNKNHSPSHDSTVVINFARMFLESVGSDFNISSQKEFIDSDIGIQKTENLIPSELIKEVCDKYYEKDCMLAKKFLGREELFINKYPNYQNQEKQDSKAVAISYKQLDILYEEFVKALEEKGKIVNPIVNFLALFIPFKTARGNFKSKYLIQRDDLYKEISFFDFSGSKNNL